MRVEKNRLYRTAQYAFNEGTEVISALWTQYRQFKNEYKNAIATKKYQCNQAKLDKVKGDMKGTWRVLNSILNRCDEDIVYVRNGDDVIESGK